MSMPRNNHCRSASPKPLFILSPCGTSLLTNEAKDGDGALVRANANAGAAKDVSEPQRKRIVALIARVKEKIRDADIPRAAAMSAELNGIMKYYENRLPDRGDHHCLLCTDTWLGETTAEIARDWLRGRQPRFTVEVRRQTDLQTRDLEAFNVALADLVKWADEAIQPFRDNGYRIVFNLTGGFKSVQGFLQTLATFYADEAIYIFETANDLLRIPRLPIRLDAEQNVRENLAIFRRLAIGLPVARVGEGIAGTMLMRVGEETALSPWGGIVWNQVKRNIYDEKVWPAPSERLLYSKDFCADVKGLQPDRCRNLNERMDMLAAFLEKPERPNLKSLDMKRLQGNPRPPSTHEADAWSDRDARRLFGHFEDGNENGSFIIDRLDKALHHG